jgi:hypothetical protein
MAMIPLRLMTTEKALPEREVEWVAQVSILRPGFLLGNRSYRNTHLIFGRAIFFLTD